MRAAAVVLVVVSLARGAAAQEQPQPPTRPTPAVIHYGKFGAAALFVGLTVMGIVEHDQANRDFRALQDFCRNGGSCAIGANGRYVDAGAESSYQAVVRGDRSARVYLAAGQVALAGATAMFVLELLKERGTHNIPFNGLQVAPDAWGRTRVGWSLHF